MRELTIKIFASLSLFILISATTLAESTNSPAAEFLVEIHKRNFIHAVNYCQTIKPEMKQVYDKYINDYTRGIISGLNKVTDSSSMQITPPDKQKEHMYQLASKQGMQLKKNLELNPQDGCTRLLNLLSKSSVSSAEQQVVTMFQEFRKKRENYCAQIPKPENCQ